MKRLITTLIVMCYGVATYAQNIRTTEIKNIVQNIEGAPNWPKIETELTAKYGKLTSDTILIGAKVEYYWKMKQYERYIPEFIKLVEYNPESIRMNNAAWRVFEYATQAEHLARAESWAKEAFNKEPENYYIMDTYANILYKSGKVQKAIEWETRVSWASKLDPRFVATLFRMKAGIPTWKYPLTAMPRDESFEEQIWISIQQKFSREVDSLMWASKLKESKTYEDKTKRTRLTMNYVKKFKPQGSDQLNECAWTVFQCSNQKSELTTALQWSKESLKDASQNPAYYAYLDTYANLLYKLGQQKEAVKWSEKALFLAPAYEKAEFEGTLAKIRNGENTW